MTLHSAAATILLCLLASPTTAHEVKLPSGNTVNYQNWVNGLDHGCCNNQDCRPIADAQVRMSPRVEVNIEGHWCPVLPHHYLKRGNAPDWSSAHVCVRIGYGEERATSSPCERLLCFQPKPLS